VVRILLSEVIEETTNQEANAPANDKEHSHVDENNDDVDGWRKFPGSTNIADKPTKEIKVGTGGRAARKRND